MSYSISFEANFDDQLFIWTKCYVRMLYVFLRVAVAGHKMTGCTIGILTLGGKTFYRFSPSFQSQTR